jgi:hypothetical protein
LVYKRIKFTLEISIYKNPSTFSIERGVQNPVLYVPFFVHDIVGINDYVNFLSNSYICTYSIYYEHCRRKVQRGEHGAKLCKGAPYDVLIVRENLQYITLYYILSDTNATRIYILS